MKDLRAAFTLIELLVVVTIIVVLLALLTPALDRAIYQAELTVCAANQHTVGAGAAKVSSFKWIVSDQEENLGSGCQTSHPDLDGLGSVTLHQDRDTIAGDQWPSILPSTGRTTFSFWWCAPPKGRVDMNYTADDL